MKRVAVITGICFLIPFVLVGAVIICVAGTLADALHGGRGLKR